MVLVAAIVGVVALASGGGNDGSASSSKLDTSFTEPAHFDSIDAVYNEEDFSCGATDSRCIEKYMIKVTDDYGPRASLGVLERLQHEQKVNMSVNDHQMAHVVGRDTAKDYGSNFKAFDLCPTTFNYGCSHGFFEYVLARTPDARKAATTICESLNPETNLLIAGFTCYHGVGHGIMMAQGYDVQKSLKECNTMPGAKDKDGCWQGVFMENVNAGMQGRALPGYFKKSDPLSPCDKVGNRYKHECFINHAGLADDGCEGQHERGQPLLPEGQAGEIQVELLAVARADGHQPGLAGHARERPRRRLSREDRRRPL